MPTDTKVHQGSIRQAAQLRLSDYAPAVELVACLDDLEMATHDVDANTVDIERLSLGKRVGEVLDTVREAKAMYDDAVKMLAAVSMDAMEQQAEQDDRAAYHGDKDHDCSVDA